MADKKALPTFDFNKRQRTTKLDILAEEQAEGDNQVEAAKSEAEPKQPPQVERLPATTTSVQVQTQPPTSPFTAQQQLDQTETVKNRGGRPRASVQKVKKNYQLATTDLDNLDAAAMELTSQARIRIKDDSSVIGLALVWLRETVENGDQTQLNRLVELYQNR